MRQEAIVCFQRALQVRPDFAMAYGEAILFLWNIAFALACICAGLAFHLLWL